MNYEKIRVRVIDLKQGDFFIFNEKSRVIWTCERSGSQITVVRSQHGHRRSFVGNDRLREIWRVTG